MPVAGVSDLGLRDQGSLRAPPGLEELSSKRPATAERKPVAGVCDLGLRDQGSLRVPSGLTEASYSGAIACSRGL